MQRNTPTPSFPLENEKGKGDGKKACRTPEKTQIGTEPIPYCLQPHGCRTEKKKGRRRRPARCSDETVSHELADRPEADDGDADGSDAADDGEVAFHLEVSCQTGDYALSIIKSFI